MRSERTLDVLTAVDFGPAIEPFEPYSAPSTCNPDAQPGVKAFRDFVLANAGGADLGIVRACDVGSASLHHEGRAWDWGNNASNPEDVTRVQAALDWLFAKDAYGNDAAMFRRVGLTHLIWNGQSWSTTTKQWKPYTGHSPHTDHVHFSFGWPGALAETSFYRAGGVVVPPSSTRSYNWLGVVLIAAGIAYLGYTWKRRR